VFRLKFYKLTRAAGAKVAKKVMKKMNHASCKACRDSGAHSDATTYIPSLQGQL
jgi:hypothetical protein